MLRSFYNAITGMDVARFALDITSDNLANANTVGFKKSRPIFQDMVSQVVVGLNTTTGTVKTTTFGAGAVVDSTQKVWTIGSFKQTENTTDLAIEGKALFILKDALTNQTYYTRDGRFRINREGYLINPNGLYVQGFKVNPVTREVTGTQVENVRVETQIPPKATGEIYFNSPTNLNADAQPPSVTTFDPTNSSSYNYRYTITIYDSLGHPYDAHIFFKKDSTASNTWRMFVLADYNNDNTLEDLINTRNNDKKDGGYKYITLQFDTNGKLLESSTDDSETQGDKKYFFINIHTGTVNTSSGGTIGDIKLYVGDEDVGDTKNYIQNSYITQHAANFVVTMDQDGYARGELIDVYVLSEDGVVVGVYSNGESLPMYRLALAQFTDPEELVKKGSNLYASVKLPTILLPGGSNKIRSAVVEMSNVDIAKEFINLITAQRTYQANARTITVANTILEDTINLVR